MVSAKWTEQEMQGIRRMDLEIAKLVSEYVGGPWHRDSLFVPSRENIEKFQSAVEEKKREVGRMADAFWREHFTSALESLEFSIECNRQMPYEYITRLSSGFDSLASESNKKPKDERARVLASRLAQMPAVLAGIKELLEHCGDLGRSQVADMLPPIFGNISKAVAFVSENAESEGMKRDAETNGARAVAAAREIEAIVKSLPLTSLKVADIPFEFAVEKGMQVPLDYILSWYEDDVEMRRKEFFRVAKAIDPARDAYDLLNNGSPGYTTVEAIYDDMRRILRHLREACLNFIDLPEGEMCDVGDIPETWRKVCPTFMYMDGIVCINPENIPAFRRSSIEETLAHEVYPGHHAHRVKSGQSDLPHTFKTSLFLARCLDEGIAHRSEYLMIPYFEDPIARLDSARRGWYCSTRVKVEVDLYYHRKPVKEVIDNYMNNLNCTEYSAYGQTRAHMMRPADGISYYTGMRFVEDLYKKSGASMKDFTNEVFSYGHVALGTLKNILELSPEKKAQLKAFAPIRG